MFDGYFLTETANRTQLKQWENAIRVQAKLPLSPHLLTLYEIKGYTKKYTMPGLQGTLSECLPFFTNDMLCDALLQVAEGLHQMHKVGIIHQQLSEDAIYVVRNVQQLCGFLMVVGNFEFSGARVFGQSLLNPQRPTPAWDVNAFYNMGVRLDIPNWPKLNSLDAYRAYLWMKPVEYPLPHSNVLRAVMDCNKELHPVAQRLCYVFKCATYKHRVLHEHKMLVYPSDAELLAICVQLQKRAEQCININAANVFYHAILEIMELILWETPERAYIMELKEYISSLLIK
jgi:hypothetical protein